MRKGKATMKSRLGGFVDLSSRSVPAVPWAIDANPSSSYDISWANASAVVGTCTDLEKRFLRLTSVSYPNVFDIFTSQSKLYYLNLITLCNLP